MGTIIRAARPEADYTQIRNEVLRDARCSFRARGLLAYLLSHVDNWRWNVDQLAAQNPEGKQALYVCLKELQAAGYLTQRRIHDKATGKFAWETTVYDMPQTGTPEVKQVKARPDYAKEQAVSLVREAWEPVSRGKTAQSTVSVVKIVETALRNEVAIDKVGTALSSLATAGATVTAYSLNRAINGEPIRGQLKADQTVNWALESEAL